VAVIIQLIYPVIPVMSLSFNQAGRKKKRSPGSVRLEMLSLVMLRIQT